MSSRPKHGFRVDDIVIGVDVHNNELGKITGFGRKLDNSIHQITLVAWPDGTSVTNTGSLKRVEGNA